MIERVAFALQYLRRHPLLCRLLRTEPEAILPSLTVNGGPVVDLAREHSAALIRRDLFGPQAPPAEAERRIQTVAELGVRIVLSFILTPSSAIPMDTLEMPGPSPGFDRPGTPGPAQREGAPRGRREPPCRRPPPAGRQRRAAGGAPSAGRAAGALDGLADDGAKGGRVVGG